MVVSLKNVVQGSASLALGALLSSSAFAQGPQVAIRGVTYAGSGCPAGSVAQNLSADAQALTLLFESFVAEVGPSIPLSAKRRNCQISVNLEFPNGWTFSLVDVDYRGYVSLEPNVTSTQQSSYYFSGEATTARLATNYRGPIDQDYHIRDSLAVQSQVWAPCGVRRNLNINAEVRTDNALARTRRGVMTLDSSDFKVTHVYGLRWRRCGF